MGLFKLWHLIYPRLSRLSCLPHKLICFGISGRVFGLILSFVSNRWLRVVPDGRYLQGCSTQYCNFWRLHFWSLYINYIPDDVMWNIIIYCDDTTLCPKCDQAFDLLGQPEDVSQFDSCLQDSIDWCRKRLIDFNTEKNCFVWIV